MLLVYNIINKLMQALLDYFAPSLNKDLIINYYAKLCWCAITCKTIVCKLY